MYDKRTRFIDYIRKSPSFQRVLKQYRDYEGEKMVNPDHPLQPEETTSSLYMYMAATKETLADSLNFRKRQTLKSIFEPLKDKPEMLIYAGFTDVSPSCLVGLVDELGYDGNKTFKQGVHERVETSMNDGYSVHGITVNFKCAGFYFLSGLTRYEALVCEGAFSKIISDCI